MKGSLYTILYAMALSSFCALILTGVGRFAAPYREANAKAEKIFNILQVLGVPVQEDASSQELLKIFEENVRAETHGALDVYLYAQAQRAPKAIAISFGGPGLWGPIKGLLALEPDKTTIRGITFYEQEETPGLGGEISSPSFQNQFEGKSIRGPGAQLGIKIIRGGGASEPNEVDAITGATMTSEKVQAMLNQAIATFITEYAEREP